MRAPNMATNTASIERSLQNCSLNHHQSSSSSSNSNDSHNSTGIGRPRSSTSDTTQNHDLPDNTLELNSEIRLPHYWEQCLDLEAGEVYYINWRTGMKTQEDPRTNPGMNTSNGLLCSGREDEDDGSSYESEESSTEESPPSTSREQSSHYNHNPPPSIRESNDKPQPPPQVLVVAGCKSCFMYFMVPKQLEDCPKCFGQLLHFDRSENPSP